MGKIWGNICHKSTIPHSSSSTHSLTESHAFYEDKALFTHLVEATLPAPNRTGSLDMRNLYNGVLTDPQNGTWGSITI